jgi:sialic acid synthase SpsE
MDAAGEAGADAVKFQWVYAAEILHPASGLVPLPGGDVPLFERFRSLEVGPDFFAAAAAYARSLGLRFVCSPFGLQSLAELLALKPDAVKIASPELNHYPLLEALAAALTSAESRPRVILSSGVSRLSDIEKALGILTLPVSPGHPPLPLTLLHCVTSYPAPEGDYNLGVLPHLAGLFGVSVGVSDHSFDPVLVPTLAAVQGAVMVEKHITLSTAEGGLDDIMALEPPQFAEMVASMRRAEGEGREATMERLRTDFGKKRVAAVLGDGVKRLAPSEAANYGRTNRSLHYLRALPAGHILASADIAVLRTEKVLTPGLSPEHLPTVMGATLKRAVDNGAGVGWGDVVAREGEQ